MEGFRNYANFEVIDIVDDMNIYPALLRINWVINNQTIIHFKKRILSFEDTELRVVSPIDPLEGHKYVEQVNIEGQEGYLDNIYNISSAMDDYANPTTDGKQIR